jgi:B9 domain-containing protein 1
VRLYKPRSASPLQAFLSWLSGMPAEFADHRFPAYGSGREGEALGAAAGCDPAC